MNVEGGKYLEGAIPSVATAVYLIFSGALVSRLAEHHG